MNVYVVEDEVLARQELIYLLKDTGKINVVGEADDIHQALWDINEKQPDAVFLDIELEGGNGLELAKQFSNMKKPPMVVFVTAYDEYALNAFKLNSIDYLLKPIDEDDLVVAVSKFKSRLPKQETLQLDFEQIKKMLSNPFDKNFKKRFTVKIGQHLKVILVEEIECFFSENKGTYIHTFDNRNFLIETTLELLEQDLDPSEFFRVSRKFIIPLKAIKEIVVHSNSRLKVILPSYKDEEVIVSREKVADFKNWIG